jgi:hypothetical protein
MEKDMEMGIKSSKIKVCSFPIDTQNTSETTEVLTEITRKSDY